MSKYIGTNCPVCSKLFMDDDDIVVCPKCGAPYHRHCYLSEGECIFDELHEKGEAWQIPEIDLPKKAPAYEIKDQECPTCKVLNAHSSIFCAHCGSPLKISPDVHQNRNSPTNNINTPINIGSVPMFLDPMGGVSPSDTIDENINYGDVSKLVQQNTAYYLPVFQKIKMSKKNKFNFSAFLFSGGWLLFRKQYKIGIIISIVMFTLYLAQTFTTLYVSFPLITNMFAELGISIPVSGPTAEQISMLSQNMTNEQLILVSLPMFITFAMFIIMLIVGATANKVYMKNCIKSINKIRQTTVNYEDFNTRINERGGVNTSATICLIICYFLCTYLPTFLIG